MLLQCSSKIKKSSTHLGNIENYHDRTVLLDRDNYGNFDLSATVHHLFEPGGRLHGRTCVQNCTQNFYTGLLIRISSRDYGPEALLSQLVNTCTNPAVQPTLILAFFS